VIVRPAGAQDAAAIAAVHAASWRDTYGGMLPEDYLANAVGADLEQQWTAHDFRERDVVLVAEDDGAGKIAGFIAIWCRPDPFIDNLHVDPAQRSAGLGVKLMRAAGAELIARGHGTAWLWVFADNVRAIAFYERLGGTVIARADKQVFGHQVPSLKIAWDDLRAVIR